MTLILNGRATVYTGEVPYCDDVLRTGLYKMVDISQLSQTILGTGINNIPLVRGFNTIPISPGGLSVEVQPGVIYHLDDLDATAWSDLPADTNPDHVLYKQGLHFDTEDFTTPAPTTVGNSVIHLIQVEYQSSDVNVTNRPYFNDANPPSPIYIAASDTRQDLAVVSRKLGIEGVSPTPPTPDAGNVGLYYVTVTYGQTVIVSGDITPFPGAPFIIEGLTQKISQTTADNLYLSSTVEFASVSYTNGSTQTVANGNTIDLNFNQIVSDNNNWYSVNTFTPTIPGKYEIEFRVEAQSFPAGFGIIALTKNGSVIEYLWENFGNGTDDLQMSGTSSIFSMNGTSDQVKLQFINNTGSSVTLGNTSGTNPEVKNRCQIKYIGK